MLILECAGRQCSRVDDVRGAGELILNPAAARQILLRGTIQRILVMEVGGLIIAVRETGSLAASVVITIAGGAGKRQCDLRDVSIGRWGRRRVGRGRVPTVVRVETVGIADLHRVSLGIGGVDDLSGGVVGIGERKVTAPGPALRDAGIPAQGVSGAEIRIIMMSDSRYRTERG